MFQRPAARSVKLQDVPEETEDSSIAANPLQEDVVLTVQAQLEDRQEARRRITVRGGKIFQDKGSLSDADEEQQQELEPGAVTVAYSTCGSPSDSLNGTLSGADGLSPSARYWRERASLTGGRLSVEAHAARLRERHQVQAELRAWCEEVLEGWDNKQPQQRPEADGQKTASNAGRRWCELPASLHSQLTSETSPRCSHLQHRRDPHHRHSSIATTAASTPECAETALCTSSIDSQHHCLPLTSSSAQALQPLHQQQDVWGCAASCAAGGAAGPHRTKEAYGDEAQHQLQHRVGHEVQQLFMQWQQRNPAEDYLAQQLLQQYEQLQLQLARARQQISALTGQSPTLTSQPPARPNAAAATVTSGHGIAHPASMDCTANRSKSKTSAKGYMQQQEVLTEHGPDVQVLTILRDDSAGSASAIAGKQWQGNAVYGSKQRQQQSRESASDLSMYQTAAAATPSRQAAASKSLLPAAAVDAGAAFTATRCNANESHGTNTGKAAGRRWTATACKTANGVVVRSGQGGGANRARAMGESISNSSKGPADSTWDPQLLGVEQQHVLIERLKHAEGVMQMLQADLEASLAVQYELSQQLEQQKAATHQAKQQQQCSPCQPASASVGPEQQQQHKHLQQIGNLTTDLYGMKLQLAAAQQEAAAANKQLQDRLAHCQLLEQEWHAQQMKEAQLQQQVQLLQQHLAPQEVREQCLQQTQQQLHLQELSCNQQQHKEVQLLEQVKHLQQQPYQLQKSGQQVHHYEQHTMAGEVEQQVEQLQERLQRSLELAITSEAMQAQQHHSAHALDRSNVTATSAEHAVCCDVQQQSEQAVQSLELLQDTSAGVAAQQPECARCQLLTLRIQQLQQQKQNVLDDGEKCTAVRAGPVDCSDVVGLCSRVDCSRKHTSGNGSARSCTTTSPRKQPLQQQLPLKTIVCPPVPALAAVQTPTGPANLHNSECDVASGAASARAPKAEMLAGMCKIKPLSCNRPRTERGTIPGVIGTSLARAWTASAAAQTIWQHEAALSGSSACQQQLSAGAEKLLLIGLMTSQLAMQEKPLLQIRTGGVCQGTYCSCSSSSTSCAAYCLQCRVGSNTDSIDAGQPGYGNLHMQPRSSSPRRHTPRVCMLPRPASALSCSVNSAAGGVALAYAVSPRRPKTSGCTHGQAGNPRQQHAAVPCSAQPLATVYSSADDAVTASVGPQKPRWDACDSIDMKHPETLNGHLMVGMSRRPGSSSSMLRSKKAIAVPRLKLGCVLLSNNQW